MLDDITVLGESVAEAPPAGLRDSVLAAITAEAQVAADAPADRPGAGRRAARSGRADPPAPVVGAGDGGRRGDRHHWRRAHRHPRRRCSDGRHDGRRARGRRRRGRRADRVSGRPAARQVRGRRRHGALRRRHRGSRRCPGLAAVGDRRRPAGQHGHVRARRRRPRRVRDGRHRTRRCRLRRHDRARRRQRAAHRRHHLGPPESIRVSWRRRHPTLRRQTLG